MSPEILMPQLAAGMEKGRLVRRAIVSATGAQRTAAFQRFLGNPLRLLLS